MMDPIEPIRLDMNLFNTAILQKQHEAGLAETMRHHGVLEQQAAIQSGAAYEKVQADELHQVIQNPEMSPILRHQAASKLYTMATRGQGQQLDPIDYTTYMGKWNAFLAANKGGTQSQEAAQAAQDLAQYSPFAREEMKAAQARQQAVETSQGFASMPTRAGQPALTPQESTAVQGSPPAQKAIAESAFPSAKDTAVMNEVNQRTAALKVQEATATYAYQAMNKTMTPVFNMDAEEAHLKTASQITLGSPLTSRLTTKDQTDQSALMAGTLTTDERQQAKAAIPDAMKEMNQQARALQQELHNANNDMTGTARPPEQIQADLVALRTAVTIKGKELAYLSNPTTANRLAVKQGYESFQKDLDQKKAEVLRLRQQSSTVAQGALNERIAQDAFQNKQKLDLAAAQLEYKTTGNLKGAAQKFPNIPIDDIRQIDKNLNQPLVSITQKQEGAESAKVGEQFGTEYGALQKSAIDATSSIAKLDRMSQLMEGVHTGKLTPAITQVQAIGQSLGIDVDKTLPAKQALEALSNEIALTLRNPSGGAGMPGALSDKDREFLQSMTPGLGKTPEGNRLIIGTAKALAKRSQDVAKMARDYRKKNGHFDEGFFDELQSYSEQHQLFAGQSIPSVANPLMTPSELVAPFHDPEKERRYQEFKRKHK